MTCTVRRPDLMLEDQDEQKLLSVDLWCPNEDNKTEKQAGEIQKYKQLPNKLQKRCPEFMVKVVLMFIGCLGGRIP